MAQDETYCDRSLSHVIIFSPMSLCLRNCFDAEKEENLTNLPYVFNHFYVGNHSYTWLHVISHLT